MKTKHFFILLLFFIPGITLCQSSEFIGIIGSNLVLTDAQTGDTEFLSSINIPSGDQLRFFGFCPRRLSVLRNPQWQHQPYFGQC